MDQIVKQFEFSFKMEVQVEVRQIIFRNVQIEGKENNLNARKWSKQTKTYTNVDLGKDKIIIDLNLR